MKNLLSQMVWRNILILFGACPVLPIWLFASSVILISCSNPIVEPVNNTLSGKQVGIFAPPIIKISKLDFGELKSQTDTEAFVTVIRRKVQVENYTYYQPLGIIYSIDVPNGIRSVETSDKLVPGYVPPSQFARGDKQVIFEWYPSRVLTGVPVTITVTDLALKEASFTVYPTFEVNLDPSDVVTAAWERIEFIKSVDYPHFIAAADKSLLALSGGILHKSSDKGATWKEIAISGIKNVGAIALHPSGTLYAGSGSDSKIATSTNDGETWSLLTTNLPHALTGTNGIESMCITKDGTLQVALVPGVWRSQDGENWSLSNSDLAGYNYSMPLMVALNESTTLAFGHEGGWLWQCMVRSSDFGKTWKCLDVSSSVWFTSVIYASDGNVYASAEQGIYKSEDLGVSWIKLNSGIPEGFHNIINTIIEGEDGKIYAAPTNFGVFRLEGDTWKSVGTNLATFNVTNMVAVDGHVYAFAEPSALYKLK